MKNRKKILITLIIIIFFIIIFTLATKKIIYEVNKTIEETAAEAYETAYEEATTAATAATTVANQTQEVHNLMDEGYLPLEECMILSGYTQSEFCDNRYDKTIASLPVNITFNFIGDKVQIVFAIVKAILTPV